jgi:hypothetical protein
MKDKNDISKKLFNAALLGVVCVAPFVGGMAAQAAPPDHGRRGHDSSQSQSRDKNRDSKQSHDQNRGHGNTSNRSHATPQPQSHNFHQSRPTDRSHAAPQSQPQNSQRHSDYQQHRANQSNHNFNQSRPANQNHTALKPQNSQRHTNTQAHPTNRSHNTYQSHTTTRSHVTPPAHHVTPSSHQNWQRTSNDHYDDNWHRGHGYTKNGSHWNWRGHDDNWWISNGYGWNGSQWLRQGNSHVVVKFRGNRDRDDNWHRSHGYIRRGSGWYWHGHDDDYWHNNGYFWNGTIWLLLNNSHRNYYPNYSYGSYRNFSGVVTRVYYGENKIDVRINGRIFNVYVSTRLPYRLNRGDLVRVYGRRYGDNDIRNSSVKILRNR